MKIKSVTLHYPNSDCGEMLDFTVGKRGVTEIKEAERTAEYCMIKYYQIFKNGKLVSELHHYSQVDYFEEPSETAEANNG